jgi:hypothetical protein
MHRAAGLSVAADRAVPGLAPAPTQGTADVTFHFGAPAPWHVADSEPHYIAPHTDPTERPVVAVRRAQGGFHFDYADHTQVWVGSDGREVWCTWPPSATFEDTATYLTGPILGFVLRLRGALALHASAVQIGGRALVLVGPHAAGKSTTAAGFAQRGCPVIADDVLHVRREGRQWFAEPFAATLRLWPAGVRLALGSDAALPRITGTWDKRALAIGTAGTVGASHAVPVAAVAFLEPREPPPAAPRLEPIPASEALVRLAAHSSASHLIDGITRVREFALLAELVRATPCTRAFAADDGGCFDPFIALLLDWAQPSCGRSAD